MGSENGSAVFWIAHLESGLFHAQIQSRLGAALHNRPGRGLFHRPLRMAFKRCHVTFRHVEKVAGKNCFGN